MSLRADLVAQLQRFDEEAFAALASRGLLRRAQKDLEAQAGIVAEDAADSVTVTIGQQRVTFDRRGPAHAKCSCPAAGVCQHLLAAALWLQRQSTDAAPAAQDAGAPEILAQALLAIGEAELRKHAGKAGYRWAWQFVQDLDVERDVSLAGERHLVLAFARPRLTFRYMGGGLDQLIADVVPKHLEKYRVAAALALRRIHGVALPAPEAAGRASAPALDLGQDHALPADAATAQGESRQRLRRRARRVLEECIELGLSHLSAGIEERFATLATWAQGAEYHRLALALRRIADHVELLLERSGSADEHRLLDEMTLAYALIAALESAHAAGQAPVHLTGRARHRYDESATLELIALGARPWRSASGYVGLTMLLWSATEREFLSWTDARPQLQRGYDPVQRYTAPGPWPGLGAPAQAVGRRLVLSRPQVSAAGRVSGSERTQATVLPLADGDAVRASLPACSGWSLLQPGQHRARSLLSEAEPLRDWVVLQPAAFLPPRFDAARQTLVWPLVDAEGAVLDVEIPYSVFNANAIDRIEHCATHSLAAGTLVVAQLRAARDGFVADPLSLIAPSASDAALRIDSLYFDASPSARAPSKPRAPASHVDDSDAPAAMPRVLAAMREWLRRHAERGVGDAAQLRARTEWTEQARLLHASGLSSFPAGLTEDDALPAQLLKLHYMSLQYERLLSGSEGRDGLV